MKFKKLTVFAFVTCTLLGGLYAVAKAQQKGYNDSRYNLNKSLRTKSNTGWQTNDAVRNIREPGEERWHLNHEVRDKDATTGFNHNPEGPERKYID